MLLSEGGADAVGTATVAAAATAAAAAAAAAKLFWALVDLQIEQQMMFGENEEAGSGPPSKRRAVAGRAQGASSRVYHPVQPSHRADAASWSALADVYADLGQDDLVQVIYANCLSR